MRPLLLIGALLLVSSLALADSAAGGGGTVSVIPDPGFCWGGGVIPGPPPGIYLPTGVLPGGPEIAVALGPGGGVGVGSLSGGVTAPATSASAKQADISARRVRSQMYVPPKVWQWLARHPVRAR
jgi:hypothetical protein